MKIRPIIMQPESIHGLHNKIKTETRRIIKPQPEICDNLPGQSWYQRNKQERWCDYSHERFLEKCSYGKVGDILYVKETWGITANISTDSHKEVIELGVRRYIGYKADNPDGYWCWKSPLFMPKVFARFWLQITDIRVERVQDITNEGARAEGVKHVIDKVTGYCGYDYLSGTYNLMTTPYHGYKSLFVKINGKESWSNNVWVWVIKFKQIEEPESI